jgi:hypothetical protein
MYVFELTAEGEAATVLGWGRTRAMGCASLCQSESCFCLRTKRYESRVVLNLTTEPQTTR